MFVVVMYFVGISYPLGQMGKVYPMLYFEFEQQPKGTVKFSVSTTLNILKDNLIYSLLPHLRFFPKDFSNS